MGKESVGVDLAHWADTKTLGEFLKHLSLDMVVCGSLLEFFSGDLIKLKTVGASKQRKWLNDPEGISSDGSFCVIK